MISKLVATENIETQEDLARLLRDNGFQVTQATVSRDIKELKLIKMLSPEGRYKYATQDRKESDKQEQLVRMFSSCVLSITATGNLIIIKTIPASAQMAGEAIDSLRWPEVAGSLAGDNTIFVAIRDGKNVAEMVRKFTKLVK